MKFILALCTIIVILTDMDSKQICLRTLVSTNFTDICCLGVKHAYRYIPISYTTILCKEWMKNVRISYRLRATIKHFLRLISLLYRTNVNVWHGKVQKLFNHNDMKMQDWDFMDFGFCYKLSLNNLFVIKIKKALQSVSLPTMDKLVVSIFKMQTSLSYLLSTE